MVVGAGKWDVRVRPHGLCPGFGSVDWSEHR